MKVIIKKIVFLTLQFVLINLTVFPQAPDTLWTKMIGGSYDDYSYSVQQTSDGGYIISGSTKSFGVGEQDVLLIKTDASGEVIWEKTYGGVYDDRGYSVQQTTDNGYIICGHKDSAPYGIGDIWLIKTDAYGNLLWDKTFGGPHQERGEDVQQTTDGGYILVGYTNGDIWLLKTNTAGDTLWTKLIGGNYGDFGSSVEQTNDGGYIVGGVLNYYNGVSTDIWLIKTDAYGDTLWTKIFGGAAMRNECNDVHQTTDGGYILTGYTENFGGIENVWVIKTNAFGDTLWTKIFGGGNIDWGESVQQTSDGGYIICGTTESFSLGYFDVWIIKINESGDLIWTKTLGGSTNHAYGREINQTTDGGYIITGEIWTSSTGDYDVWLIKTAPDPTKIEENIDLFPLDFSLHQNYPNPFNPSTTIKYQIPELSFVTIRIYDVLGNEISILVSEVKPVGSYEVEFNVSNLPSGIYFYRLQAGDFIQTKKMVLMK